MDDGILSRIRAERFYPGLGRAAKSAAEHLDKCARLAVADLECRLLNRSARNQQLDCFHHAHLRAPFLEARAHLAAKNAFDGSHTGSIRAAKLVESLAAGGIGNEGPRRTERSWIVGEGKGRRHR